MRLFTQFIPAEKVLPEQFNLPLDSVDFAPKGDEVVGVKLGDGGWWVTWLVK